MSRDMAVSPGGPPFLSHLLSSSRDRCLAGPRPTFESIAKTLFVNTPASGVSP
jgi:hypothetical protein